MDKKRICIVCVIMVFSIMTGYLFEKESKRCCVNMKAQ